jgi:hypothetical protein
MDSWLFCYSIPSLSLRGTCSSPTLRLGCCYGLNIWVSPTPFLMLKPNSLRDGNRR